MNDSIKEFVADELEPLLSLRAVVNAGYSGALKYRGILASGRKVFIKHATNEFARKHLAREALAYRHLAKALMLNLVVYSPSRALLVLEDASGAHWPPPWNFDDVKGVIAAIHQLHKESFPDCVPREDIGEQLRGGWSEISMNPHAFSKLGLCSVHSIVRALPLLIEMDEANDFSGDCVSHLDLRSDNMCRTESGWKFIDWSYFSAANPALDFVLWLPGLVSEIGHVPPQLAPFAEHTFMISFAGYLAARAGLPEPEGTSGRVRKVQRRQLEVALPLAFKVIGEG